MIFYLTMWQHYSLSFHLIILVLPLFNFLFLGLTGNFLKKQNALEIAILNMIITLYCSFLVFLEIILYHESYEIPLFTWINSGMLQINWSFLFDPLTAVMLLVVTSISTCVHIYSLEYMEEDPHLQKFISYLSFFTFFMLILVTSNNLLQMFVGWEGVGLCSYLLINFWYNRLQANKAAIKAMIVNRIGDFGLAMGLFTIFYGFKSLDYTILSAMSPILLKTTLSIFTIDINILTIAAIFLFIGAVGKSAQLGLHTWLPDAMEGPTPVSALIHAATMVTAGVFLISRCSNLFQYAPTASILVTILGSLTAFVAGTIGLVQNDLKRIIAYSTCSQLGYMVFACGVSNYFVSMFHLSNHAFFKAALFMGAGSVIHALSDEQDMRKMGGSMPFLYYTFIVILIGSLSLMGFPFLTGFYSKDAILELTNAYLTIETNFASLLGNLAAGTTAFYSLRSLSKTFLTTPAGYKQLFKHAHESGKKMLYPLFFLSIGGFWIGFRSKELFLSPGTCFWQNSLSIKTQDSLFFEAEFLSNWLKDLPLLFSFTGAFLAFYIYNYTDISFKRIFFNYKLSKNSRLLYTFLNRKWFFDKVYNDIINQWILKIGYNLTYQQIDRGLIEVLGSNGLSSFIYKNMIQTNQLKINIMYHFIFIILLGVLGILFSIYWWGYFYSLWDFSLLAGILLLIFQTPFKKTFINE